ncbi:MAG TPA: SDR family oxidoreductase [Mycobacteriales bacterium]|jgi:NAD(P)-dependent dehydrogenase (short-subunit alcohol dehydrogenase family)|nr:SDR family oxidoreductase [Mycobacteriales bacterium]
MASDAPPRTVLVTGAGRGIGRAVAVLLSSQGWRVALTARGEAQLEATAAACAGPTLVITADITDPAGVERVYTEIEQAWGPVDALVANAGAAMAAPIGKTSDADWQRMLELNLTAPFRCIRRAVPAMVERGFGRIVVVASVAAKRGEPYICAYSASKHGVLGLVRSAAAELARTGVTVNAICPGYVDTPMTAETVTNIAAKTRRSEDEARQVLAGMQPTGRLIDPLEVAQAVWFCLQNPSVTGQGINVDGGAVQS